MGELVAVGVLVGVGELVEVGELVAVAVIVFVAKVFIGLGDAAVTRSTAWVTGSACGAIEFGVTWSKPLGTIEQDCNTSASKIKTTSFLHTLAVYHKCQGAD